jgi:hypothetical protein
MAGLEARRAARVRAAVPLFVARTSVLRELSALVEDERTRGAPTLGDAIDALREPYDRDGTIAAEMLLGGADARPRRSLGSILQAEGAEAARKALRQRLGSVPAGAQQQLKTSCGAQ